MATQIRTLTIDRRQLLMTGAAITATGSVPIPVSAEACSTAGRNCGEIKLGPEMPVWNVCPVTGAHFFVLIRV